MLFFCSLQVLANCILRVIRQSCFNRKVKCSDLEKVGWRQGCLEMCWQIAEGTPRQELTTQHANSTRLCHSNTCNSHQFVHSPPRLAVYVLTQLYHAPSFLLDRKPTQRILDHYGTHHDGLRREQPHGAPR
jgi:hypothetical protein